MTNLIRIPTLFVDDHAGRALPTPETVRSTARHDWIRADDPALTELIDDAEFYSDRFGPQTERNWARNAALALLRAIYKQRPELKPAKSNVDRYMKGRK